jgi:hypothetical protein
LTPSSPSLQSALQRITEYFAHSGSSGSARSQAIGYIGQLVSNQAGLLGYIDVFSTWAIFAAVLVPIVLLLIRRIDLGRAPAAAGH